MGWASGSEIADSVWDEFQKYIPNDKKGKVALELVGLFESNDCDTMQECSFVNEYLKWDENNYEWKIIKGE